MKAIFILIFVILCDSLYSQTILSSLQADGTQAKRYKVARVVHDYNDWGSNSQIEVELDEMTFSRGLKKKYIINVGYYDFAECYLADYQGNGDNLARVVLGNKTQLNGDLYYYDIYIDVRYYAKYNAKITTSRPVVLNTEPTSAVCAIYTSPMSSNILDFTIDESVIFKEKVIFQKDINFKGNISISNLKAEGLQAKRYKVARVVHDYNDWGNNSQIEVELDETFFSKGLKKKYIINIGYSDFAECYLADYQGNGDNLARVVLGNKTQLNGDLYYYDIYIDVRYYARYNAKINTSRPMILNTEPTSAVCAIYTNPTNNNISDFSINENIKVKENSIFSKNLYVNNSLGIATNVIPNNYKLAIGGNALAEKMVVKLQTNWPDYVFHSDYALPPLSQVEEHIKTKGHLPNIPTEKEVKETGIDLGDMNAKLLQKIEELTLYLIEIKKQNEENNKRNQLLQEASKQEIQLLKEEIKKLKSK